MEQVVIYGPPQATVLRLSPPESLLRVFAQQRERARASSLKTRKGWRYQCKTEEKTKIKNYNKENGLVQAA